MTPFSMTFSPKVAQLINNLNITIALSTYQAGKLVFISAKSDDRLIQLPRTFDTPMGIAKYKNQLSISCKDEIINFTNEPAASKGYSDKQYDCFYIPTSTFYTGKVHMHDMDYGKHGLYAVNTNFSMIGIVNGNFNFQPIWKPPFIQNNMSGDQCHLNGMALLDGEPRFATALSMSNIPAGWRKDKLYGGVLIDIKTNKIVLENLQMPHSPRTYKDNLYFCQSASGELMSFDLKSNKLELVKKLDGFIRGMDIYEDFAFIGLSKIRETSDTFWDMPVAKSKNRVGLVIVHLPSKSIIDEIIYENSVDEIYDVKILPNTKRANILNTLDDKYKEVIIYPNIAFWQKNEESIQTKTNQVLIKKYFDKAEYGEYVFYDIYGIRDYDRFLIDYCLKNNILDQNTAFKKLSELTTISLNQQNNICAITIVYKDKYKQKEEYFLRVNIQNKDSSYLLKELIIFTLNSVKKRLELKKISNINRVILELENGKLNNDVLKKTLKEIGFKDDGEKNKGQGLLIYEFKKEKECH